MKKLAFPNRGKGRGILPAFFVSTDRGMTLIAANVLLSPTVSR
jgi:hypothetical protein